MSWLPFALLLLAGFLVGGLISFARTRRPILVVAMAVAAAMCVVGAVLWWDPA